MWGDCDRNAPFGTENSTVLLSSPCPVVGLCVNFCVLEIEAALVKTERGKNLGVHFADEQGSLRWGLRPVQPQGLPSVLTPGVGFILQSWTEIQLEGD